MDFENYLMSHSLKWQRRIISLFFMLAGMMFLSEIAVFLVFIFSGTLDVSYAEYILLRIVLPMGINYSALFAARHIVRKTDWSYKSKELAVAYLSVLVSSTPAIFHNYFRIFLVAFIVPFLMNSIFGDSKLLKKVIPPTIPLMLISFVSMWFDKSSVNKAEVALNIFCTLIFVYTTYYFARKLVKGQAENLRNIVDSYKRQEELIQELKIEPLTHLYNRAAYKETVTKLCQRASKGENQFNPVAAIIDLDHFKNVNDTYGHLAGDEILVTLACIIKSHMGSSRNAFRYGGEEFVLFFENCTEDDVYKKISRILSDFSATEFDFAPKVHFTFSAGICTYKAGFTADEWFNNTDALLYKAKSSGRNTITRAS
ncbi:MAG: GGDEF domain-containing protein [Treponemataceae bacterium]|nr:GGDEF domain-containing protein [Treponemataceae bacterium]